MRGKPFGVIAACLLAALLTGCGGGGGGGGGAVSTGTTGPGSPPVGASSIDDALRRAVDRGVDGIVLTVLHADGSLDAFAAGRSNQSTGEPMPVDAIYKMASVSKLYIAVAVVQLVQQGNLALGDSVAMHLPELADRIENSDVVTLRLLLQHRSGVPDFDSQPGFSWRNSHTDPDRVLGYALDKAADFPPDARYEYSNTNYLLLGMIMDRVLGYSHHVHIQNFILDPLGLDETWHLLEEVVSPRLARGYWDGDDTTRRDYVIPGGSMLATGEDIARFLDALARGQLLDPDGQAMYEQVYWLYHSGWLPGYQTIARYERVPGVTVVLHVNTTGGSSEQVISDTYDTLLAILRR